MDIDIGGIFWVICFLEEGVWWLWVIYFGGILFAFICEWSEDTLIFWYFINNFSIILIVIFLWNNSHFNKDTNKMIIKVEIKKKLIDKNNK
jgi:hypothetical protein